MWASLHGRPDPVPTSLSADLAEATEGQGIVVLGTYDDSPAGYAVAHREVLGDDTALAVVSDVYVEPGFRGLGLGAALMDALLEWAESEGCRGIDAIVLPGMRASKNFFERYHLTARAILVHRDLRAAEPPPDEAAAASLAAGGAPGGPAPISG